MANIVTRLLFFTLFLLGLAGCAGTETFTRFARAGDTVAVAVGWRQNLNRDNVTVTITPVPGGVPVVLGSGDPAIRAVFNLYPDPLSSLLVSPRIGEDLTPFAQVFAGLVESNFTGPDPDWSQTVVFVDLPGDLPVGRARIEITGGGHTDPPASIVEIIEGVGQPSNFGTEGGGLNVNQLAALGRVPNTTVNLTGAVVPHAVQIDLIHDPDRDVGGAGKAYVVNPRGDIKNIHWWDDGINLRVIMMPTDGQPLSDLAEFKFYIAGNVTGLFITDAKGYDVDGDVVPGVSAVFSSNP